MPIIFAALFAYDDLVGRALHFVGYDNLISLQTQYLYVSDKLGGISLIDFQIFELTLYLSIVIWTLRFVVGVAFLKEYDKFFSTFSDPHKVKLYGGFIFGAVFFYVDINIKLTLSGRVLFDLAKYFPRGYFVLFATVLFWCLWMISASGLFIVWKLFRQHRPGVHLWHGSPQNEGLRSPAN